MKTLATFQMLKKRLKKRASKAIEDHAIAKEDDANAYVKDIICSNENSICMYTLDEKIKDSWIEADKENMHTSGVIHSPVSNSLSPAMEFKSIPDNLHGQMTCEFNQSIRVSDDPFDILNNTPFKTMPIKAEEKQLHPSKMPDDLLLSAIKRPRGSKPTSIAARKEGIFQKLTIYSKSAMDLQSKRYYRFPFEIQTLNDGSAVFESIRNAFVSALSSAYSNYRRFGESFKVLTKEGLFVFGKDLICSNTLSRILTGFDVGFSVIDDCIVVDPGDKALVYDLIMNVEIPKGRALPFILSEFEFEDGIAYRTKSKKGPVVKSGGTIEYTHYILGPLYSSDFHVDDDARIDYTE